MTNETIDMFPGRVINGATLSACGRFRFRLWRSAPMDGRVIAFVMLNPSTADATTNDPTIRRCIGFAGEWGFSRVEVVNLFALRATDPLTLRAHADVRGPRRELGAEIRNDQAIRVVAAEAEVVVAAWGAHAGDRALRFRVPEVLALIPLHKLRCLGVTRAGHPRHPLYVPASARLVPFPPT